MSDEELDLDGDGFVVVMEVIGLVLRLVLMIVMMVMVRFIQMQRNCDGIVTDCRSQWYETG